jgi:hypothetical protein
LVAGALYEALTRKTSVEEASMDTSERVGSAILKAHAAVDESERITTERLELIVQRSASPTRRHPPTSRTAQVVG